MTSHYKHHRISCCAIAIVLFIAQGISTADATSGGAAPQFSMPRGHYSKPFELEISAPLAGASLWYTTDGSIPSSDPPNGKAVSPSQGAVPATTSLRINGTTSVRAMLLLPGQEPSSVITHSYVFPSDVLEQRTPEQLSEDWGHSGPDWEMDPDVINYPDVESRLTSKNLLTIPALFLSLPFEDFWGKNGIYIDGEGDPRKCSVELVNPLGDNKSPNLIPGLQVDGTVQITGGSSTHRWKTDKLSMRLKFHKEVEFPVFDHYSTGTGPEPARKFHTLVLDARLNESWNHSSSEQRKHGQYTRDQFVADLQNATGGFAPHGRHVHLYIAGIYWGLYNLHERPDHHFASAFLGGEPGDYDIIKHDIDDIVHGGNERFVELRDLLSGPDVASSEVYAKVTSLLDVEDFAHYILLNQWAGNTDWSHQNWYASFNHNDPDGRWRFHSWDAELTLKSPSENVTGKNDPASPSGFHQQLMRNDAYRAVFSNTIQQALHTGGLLDPNFTSDRYRQRAAEVDSAIRAESARWGDNRRRRPYTRAREWIAERDRILKDHIPDRTQILLKQFSEAGWYP